MLMRSWAGTWKKPEGLGVGGSNYHVVRVLLITVMVKSHFAMQILIALGCVLFAVDFLLYLLCRARCWQLPPASLDASVQVRINNIQQHWHLVADEKWLGHARIAQTTSSSCIHHPLKYGDAQRDEYQKSGNREVKRQKMYKGADLWVGWALCVDNPAAC